MARQQERARRTRAAIINSAAMEFAKSGYSAASLNRILEGSHATKGAMYFHFDSKEDLARAVMEAALERYDVSVHRWLARADTGPLDCLHGLVDEIALRFQHDVIVQAEFRLIIEPEFYRDVQRGGGSIWGKAAHTLAGRARAAGELRADTDLGRFTRTLAAALAGQRYLSDLLQARDNLRLRYRETLEMVVAATASDTWTQTFAARGWAVTASPDEVRVPPA